MKVSEFSLALAAVAMFAAPAFADESQAVKKVEITPPSSEAAMTTQQAATLPHSTTEAEGSGDYVSYSDLVGGHRCGRKNVQALTN